MSAQLLPLCRQVSTPWAMRSFSASAFHSRSNLMLPRCQSGKGAGPDPRRRPAIHIVDLQLRYCRGFSNGSPSELGPIAPTVAGPTAYTGRPPPTMKRPIFREPFNDAVQQLGQLYRSGFSGNMVYPEPGVLAGRMDKPRLSQIPLNFRHGQHGRV